MRFWFSLGKCVLRHKFYVTLLKMNFKCVLMVFHQKRQILMNDLSLKNNDFLLGKIYLTR